MPHQAAGGDCHGCKGSVLGLVDLDGTLVECRRLATATKIEGICSVSAPAGTPELRLVADPDDPTKRAPLFAAPILRS